MKHNQSLPEDLPTRRLTPADSNAIPLCSLMVWQAYDGEWYVDAEPLPGSPSSYPPAGDQQS